MARRLRYRIVNVFTRGDEPLSGNPLGVFENGEGLEEPTMQALARQLNLSETTFLLPSARAAARVRIFTPSYEMPFAGHPTLGSAFVCRALGRGGDSLELEMTVGMVPVTARGNLWTLTARAPSHREVETPRAELAALLGLSDGDIADRPLWIDTGREQLIVPAASAESVRRAWPRADAFKRLRSRDGEGSALLFAETGAGTVEARFFYPDGPAILEDPATGSAAANLGGHWLALGRPLPCALEIHQGEAVGRPSRLELYVDASGQVHVGGRVIELGQGYFDV